MNVLLDDLVNELVHQVQDRVVPTLEQLSERATHWKQQQQPPSTTDLVYVTDRLIVSSQPTRAWRNASYKDVGRDETRPWRSKEENPDENDDNENAEATTTGESSSSSSKQEEPQGFAALLNATVESSPSSLLVQGPNEEQSQVPDALLSMDEPPSKAEPMEIVSPLETENPQDGGTATSSSSPQVGETASSHEPLTVDAAAAADDCLPSSNASGEPSDPSTENASPQMPQSPLQAVVDDSATKPQTPAVETESKPTTSMETDDNDGGQASTAASDLVLKEAPPETSASISTDPADANISEDPQHSVASIDNNERGESSRPVSPSSVNGDPATKPQTPKETESKSEEPTLMETDDNDGGQASTTTSGLVLTEASPETPASTPTGDAGANIAAGPQHLAPSSDNNERGESSRPVSPSSVKGNDDKDATAADDTTMEESSDEPEVEEHDTAADLDATASPMDVEQDHGGESSSPEVVATTAPQHPPPPASALRNSPATIATFLENRHGRNHFLAFSLTDDRPDDRTLLLFRRQIVQMGWWSPCSERSETPSISRLLKLCYAIHAYLHLDSNNVALIYCANGKTRTAIALACYLKFSGFCSTSREGFLRFLAQRGISEPTRTWDQLPPSLHLFFQQFDTALDLGGFLNRKPLLLRAIALQGIPVEDKPCLDIWDSSQRHVYTSHPEIMWNQNNPGARSSPQQQLSQWADEEGFYRVNVVLEGDFLILCRFGGDFAEDTTIHDPSKILFRYTNTTGFLSGGYPYELTPDRVDLSRRYAPHLDDEDFLVTLLFEANWERLDDDEAGDEGEHVLPKSVMEQLGTASSVASEQIFRCYEPEACDEGLRLIVQHHSARPNRDDIRDFQKLHLDKLDDCDDHFICIALQLTNFESRRALHLLLESPSFSWWKSQSSAQMDSIESGPRWKRNRNVKETQQHAEVIAASKEILSLLDEVDMDSGLAEPDRLQLQRARQSTFVVANNSATVAVPRVLSTSYLPSAGWMVPSIMYPRQGDIIGSFTDHYQQFTKKSTQRSRSHPPSAVAMTLPRLPCFPRDKPALIPPPLPKRQRREELTPLLEFVPRLATQEMAWHLQRDLNHTHVGLSELMELIDVSQTWANKPIVSDDEDSDDDDEKEESMVPEEPANFREASLNREAKEQQQKKWEEAQKAEAKEKEKQVAEAARKKEEEETKRKDQEDSSLGPDDVPLKDDSEYSKYFKMLKMGMPKEQVVHAMTRDEKDQSILDLDPNKSLKSQRPEKKTGGEVPLDEDPEYEKYFKMLKMGLPIGAVKNALARDGKDPSVMDLDPKKSLKSQLKGVDGEDDGVPLKDDPEYTKYFKMLKMGLPVGAVKNALAKDGKDPGVMDLDPERSLKSQTAGSSGGGDGPPLKDDPEYAKYFKMLGMGLPIGAVKNALARDGKDPAIMDLDPNKSVKSQIEGGAGEADTGPPLKDDPEYAKYFKMLGMGLPIGAVKNALSRDGKDPSIMDLDPNKSVKSQLGGGVEKDTGVPLKDDPEYSKYFKMMAMGLPPGAVKNAIERDGKNPAVLDMDPTKSVAFQMKKGSASKKPVKKKKRVRRKKIYWNPIDPSKLKEDSMWNIVRGSILMDKLKYDPKEFEDLFTESEDPADQKNKKSDAKKEQKKLVQVIDPKRSMNGGIVLARLKTDHSKIAEFVNRMDHGKFDYTQLKALKEYLPDADERRGLITYMKKGDSSPEVREKLYADCSETEKYMVTMLEVPDAAAKLDAMFFRATFKNRFEETTEAIRTLNKACDELRSSEKLRKLMAMILTVVNQINTGGEGKMAMGFTLDALLKLNEAKAFDKKTSVLHYVVKLVKKNDEALLSFDRDITSVVPAENVLLDGVTNEVKAVAEELTGIHETVSQEAERLEKAGQLKPMSLADLAEQRTVVHVSGGVAQFNKVDHLTGRTSMERFTLNAKVACEQAAESIETIKKKYRAILQYFGEDEQMATADFFGTLRRFIVEWKKAVEQVEAIENKEAKEKKRAAAKARKASGMAPKKQNKPVSRKPTIKNSQSISATSDSRPGRAKTPLASSAAFSSTGNEQKTVPRNAPTGRAGGSLRTEKQSSFPDGSTERTNEAKDDGTSLAMPAFAAKAPAYGHQKEKKEDGEDASKSDFLSAASAYRRKKSQRHLSGITNDVDANSGAVATVRDNIVVSSNSWQLDADSSATKHAAGKSLEEDSSQKEKEPAEGRPIEGSSAPDAQGVIEQATEVSQLVEGAHSPVTSAAVDDPLPKLPASLFAKPEDKHVMDSPEIHTESKSVQHLEQPGAEGSSLPDAQGAIEQARVVSESVEGLPSPVTRVSIDNPLPKPSTMKSHAESKTEEHLEEPVGETAAEGSTRPDAQGAVEGLVEGSPSPSSAATRVEVDDPLLTPSSSLIISPGRKDVMDSHGESKGAQDLEELVGNVAAEGSICPGAEGTVEGFVEGGSSPPSPATRVEIHDTLPTLSSSLMISPVGEDVRDSHAECRGVQHLEELVGEAAAEGSALLDAQGVVEGLVEGHPSPRSTATRVKIDDPLPTPSSSLMVSPGRNDALDSHTESKEVQHLEEPVRETEGSTCPCAEGAVEGLVEGPPSPLAPDTRAEADGPLPKPSSSPLVSPGGQDALDSHAESEGAQHLEEPLGETAAEGSPVTGVASEDPSSEPNESSVVLSGGKDAMDSRHRRVESKTLPQLGKLVGGAPAATVSQTKERPSSPAMGTGLDEPSPELSSSLLVLPGGKNTMDNADSHTESITVPQLVESGVESVRATEAEGVLHSGVEGSIGQVTTIAFQSAGDPPSTSPVNEESRPEPSASLAVFSGNPRELSGNRNETKTLPVVVKLGGQGATDKAATVSQSMEVLPFTSRSSAIDGRPPEASIVAIPHDKDARDTIESVIETKNVAQLAEPAGGVAAKPSQSAFEHDGFASQSHLGPHSSVTNATIEDLSRLVPGMAATEATAATVSNDVEVRSLAFARNSSNQPTAGAGEANLQAPMPERTSPILDQLKGSGVVPSDAGQGTNSGANARTTPNEDHSDHKSLDATPEAYFTSSSPKALKESTYDTISPVVDEEDIFHDTNSHDSWDEAQAEASPPADNTSRPARKELSLSQFLSANKKTTMLFRGLDSFFDVEEGDTPNVPISPYPDDSSVAIMADTLQRRNLDSQMSESWIQGDTIQNFLGWADAAIKSSDTESVRNFEMSRDLNDINDFDDDSTIATYQDDVSVGGWNTPSRSTSYSNFANMDGTFDIDTPIGVSEVQAVTPAQVAASILFSDSPVNSAERTPSASNLRQATDLDILDMGLAIPTNDFGVDAGLSFAVEDAGFDDGLGFGESGLFYGNDDSFTGGLPNLSLQSKNNEPPKSPGRKSWFSWRG